MMKRHFKTISLYVSGEILFTILIGFLFFFFIFFVNQLLLMAERILSRQVPLWNVVLLVVYSIPIIITYSLPFGTLVGSLMAIGRLSSDNEMLAFRASGISIKRILLPILLLGLVLSLLSFVVGDYFLPLGNIRLKTLLKKVIFKNPAVELEPYSVKRYEDTVIITGNVTGNRIEDLVILDTTTENKKRVIMAAEAFVEPSSDQRNAVSLRIENAFSQVSDPAERGSFEYGFVTTVIYNILLKDISVSMINPGPAEMSSVDVLKEIRLIGVKFQERLDKQDETVRKLKYDLVQEIRATIISMGEENGVLLPEKRRELAMIAETLARERKKPIFDRNLQSFRMEFHRKFASPFSCLVFIFFAFPVGCLARRSGRSLGFGIGIIMSAFYWGVLLVSYRLGSRMNMSPLIAMWIPNFLIFAAGALLLLRKIRQ